MARIGTWRIVVTFPALALLAMPSMARYAAQDPDATAHASIAIDALFAREKKIRSLSFVATTKRDGKLIHRTRYWFKRPLWERIEREGTTIVTDGVTRWSYSKGQGLSKGSAKDAGLLAPLMFLGIYGDPLDQSFTRITTMRTTLQGRPTTAIVLSTVSSHQYQYFIFVDGRTGWPVAMKVTTSEDKSVDWIYISNLAIDKPMPANTFVLPSTSAQLAKRKRGGS
jgi:outer membrane lipoprotein-sorting protein